MRKFLMAFLAALATVGMTVMAGAVGASPGKLCPPATKGDADTALFDTATNQYAASSAKATAAYDKGLNDGALSYVQDTISYVYNIMSPYDQNECDMAMSDVTLYMGRADTRYGYASTDFANGETAFGQANGAYAVPAYDTCVSWCTTANGYYSSAYTWAVDSDDCSSIATSQMWYAYNVALIYY